jgi:hypothetical protein
MSVYSYVLPLKLLRVQILLIQLNFGLYWSNTTTTLHYAQNEILW